MESARIIKPHVVEADVPHVGNMTSFYAFEAGRPSSRAGVNVTVAAPFLAAICDIRRCPMQAKLVGYPGLVATPGVLDAVNAIASSR